MYSTVDCKRNWQKITLGKFVGRIWYQKKTLSVDEDLCTTDLSCLQMEEC